MQARFTCVINAPDGSDLKALVSAMKKMAKAQGLNLSGIACDVIEKPPAVISNRVVYTDGGCSKYTAIGGWAFAYEEEGKTKIFWGGTVQTTNNQMELTAVIEALKHVPGDMVIVSDSQYVVQGASSWSLNWIKNGWISSTGDPVKNQDHWKELLALCEGRDVKFQWVKGHAGHKMNETCDEWATQGQKRAAHMKASHKNGIPV